MGNHRTKIIMQNHTGELYEVKSFDSCTVSKAITESISTFSFKLETFDIEYLSENFSIGTEVKIYQGTEDNMVHTITGWVNQEPRTLNGPVKSIQYSGVDYGGRLQYRIVNEAFEDAPIEEIVTRLMSKYAPEFYLEVATTGINITARYNKLFLFDVLKELADIVNFDSFIDKNKTYKFIPSGGIPFTGKVQKILSTGQFTRGSANFSKDASRLVNRLLVAGGEVQSSPMLDSYTYTPNMNNYIQLKRHPRGTERRSEEFDNRTEFLFQNNFSEEKTGKRKAILGEDNNWQVKGLKYPEGISQCTLEMILTKKDLASSIQEVTPLFLEFRPGQTSGSAKGIGAYISVGRLRFFIQHGNEDSNTRLYVDLSEKDLWRADGPSVLQLKWRERILEIWVNGELKASKESDKDIDFYTDEAWMKNPILLLNYPKTIHCETYKLSFLARTEDELSTFVNPDLLLDKIWVYKNGLQLRVGTENLQEDEFYDVMVDFNEKSFIFNPDLKLANGDKIDIHYTYTYPIMDVLENPSSQAKYGLFEDKLILQSNNREYVKAQAHRHLQKYSKPVLIGSVEPFQMDFECGEHITVDIPELGIFERDVRITAIDYSSKPGEVTCRINLETEANVSKLFANIIKRVEAIEVEKFYNEEEEIQQIEKIVDTLTILEVYEITDHLDFVFDEAKYDFAEFGGIPEGVQEIEGGNYE